MKYWQRSALLAAVALSAGILMGCGGATAPDAVDPMVEQVEPEIESPQQAPTPDTDLEVVPDLTPEAKTPVVVEQPPQKVQLGGRVSFDRVPFAERYHHGLDYSKTLPFPVRGTVVQLLDGSNNIIAQTLTDDDGNYGFSVDKELEVRVRVVAQLANAEQAVWDIQVRDNTASDAQYVLEGTLASSGTQHQQTRNLHAASGWADGQYSADRSAAPFAILDSLYDAVQLVVDAAPYSVLPPLTVYWSSNNIAISGNRREGHIGTSFFSGSGPSIYLLGAADNDSDEYDRGVIQHEFAHYLEHQLGRSESVGGSHSQSSRLDMRVAFGEAWGNAFAGMASNDPLYRDSLGEGQSRGFTINVESRAQRNNGWYSEASVQALLYDLFDADADGGDELELGFKPLLEVLTSNEYRDFSGMASVYPFISQLKAQQPELSGAIDSLTEGFSIFGKGWFGEGETNDGGAPSVLPIYHHVALGQMVNVCSDSQHQDSNGLDVRRFIRVELPQTRSYNIRAYRSAGLAPANPQIRIFRQGAQVGSVLNGTPNHEDAIRYLTAGTYIFELYEQSNADGRDGNGGLVCFDVTIE